MRRIGDAAVLAVGLGTALAAVLYGSSLVVLENVEDDPGWLQDSSAALGAVFVVGFGAAVAILVVGHQVHPSRVAKAAHELGLRSDLRALAEIPPGRYPEPAEHLPGRSELELGTSRPTNAHSGRWHGLDVLVFELTTRHHTSWWADHARKHGYSCAAAVRPTGRRGAWVESTRLRRLYSKHVPDAPFEAGGWTDGGSLELREWLAGLPGRWGLKIDDPWIFLYETPQVTTAEGLTRLLDTIAELVARLPAEQSPSERG